MPMGPKQRRELQEEAEIKTLVKLGKVQWNGQGVPPFAAKNVTKTSLVGGQWRTKDGKRYDIVITDNKTAPNIPLGGKMEAIA